HSSSYVHALVDAGEPHLPAISPPSLPLSRAVKRTRRGWFVGLGGAALATLGLALGVAIHGTASRSTSLSPRDVHALPAGGSSAGAGSPAVVDVAPVAGSGAADNGSSATRAASGTGAGDGPPAGSAPGSPASDARSPATAPGSVSDARSPATGP